MLNHGLPFYKDLISKGATHWSQLEVGLPQMTLGVGEIQFSLSQRGNREAKKTLKALSWKIPFLPQVPVSPLGTYGIQLYWEGLRWGPNCVSKTNLDLALDADTSGTGLVLGISWRGLAARRTDWLPQILKASVVNPPCSLELENFFSSSYLLELCLPSPE